MTDAGSWAKRPIDDTHLGNSYSPDLRGRRSRAVFNIDVHWRRAAQPLPSILVTEATVESRAIEDTEGLYSIPHGGRFPVVMYPEEAPRPLAVSARTFAYAFYYEGMCTPAGRSLGKRIDCFRAAELLYLHAVARGDLQAHVGLGRIYVDDLCEGHYFDAVKFNLLEDVTVPKERVDQMAFEHLEFATSKGEPEAAYLLGDLLREGRGCASDLSAALDRYLASYDLAKKITPSSVVVRGRCALRLGRAFEEGEGCAFDFDGALRYYREAAEILEVAVDDGAWYLGIELAGAKRGVKRTQQELKLRQRRHLL